jgi:hypothetical protein
MKTIIGTKYFGRVVISTIALPEKEKVTQEYESIVHLEDVQWSLYKRHDHDACFSHQHMVKFALSLDDDYERRVKEYHSCLKSHGLIKRWWLWLPVVFLRELMRAFRRTIFLTRKLAIR